MSDRKRYADQVEQLFSRVVAELQAASDEEILAGESPDTVKQRGLALLHRAQGTAGRVRLASARRALIANAKTVPTPSVNESASDGSQVGPRWRAATWSIETVLVMVPGVKLILCPVSQL